MPPPLRRSGLRLAFAATVYCWVILFGSLLELLSYSSAAQNTQGLAVVGGGSSTINSQMLIDATQFATGTDMCGAIATACSRLGTTSYPLGATIDARGFTGNQVCLASNITTMLFKCVPSTSNPTPTGGKLLLGDVNLYADGPTLNPYYTDGTSGIGTPALILPSMFWGIEGISRGASTPNGANTGAGTFLSICLGSNNPVGINHLSPAPGSPSCSTAFPKRLFQITSTSVSTVSGVTSMTITLPDPVTSGTTVYLGELVMVKGSGTSSNNGTYAVQSITNSSGPGSHGTVTVTVPTGTANCSSGGCGSLYLGTPILGFASTDKPYNDSSCFPSGCAGFGEHIKNLGFNCQSLDGCIGWQNLYAQEESGADTFLVNGYAFVGADVHHNAQNFGPILNAEIYTGSGNTNCAEGTTGIYIGDKPMRGLDGWTINTPAESADPPVPPPCANQIMPTTAVLLDATNTEVRNGHCEGFVNCVLMGANNNPSGGLGASGEHVIGIDGPPSSDGTNTVQISGNYPANSGFVIERIRKHGDANTVVDNINNVTLSDNFVGMYSYAGIRAGAVASGVLANTDLAGQCNLSAGGGTCSFTFTQSHTNPPICTCADATAAAACRVQVTATSLTISGTATHTVDYICVGRN